MASNSVDLDSSALPEQIQPDQPKVYHSTKPLPLKMEVISRYTLGQTKTKIAKECNIEHNTVNKILRESKIDENVFAAGKFGVKTLILDSVEGVAHHVGKKSLKACTYVLDNTIFKEESGGRTFSANMQVNVHIPRPDPKQFEQRQIASNSEVLEASTTTNSGSTAKSKR